MTDNCFVCTTPYQIVAAVAIAMNTDATGELLIVPQFKDAELYFYRIRSRNIFTNVRIVDTSKLESYKNQHNRMLFGFGIVKNYLTLSSVVQKVTEENDYKTIFVSSQANIGRLISLYYLRKGAEVIFFDDGEGSYDDNKIYEAQGIDRKIRFALFGSKSLRLSNKRMLYCPELYKRTFGDHDNVLEIPNWAESQQILDEINYISGFSSDATIKQPYVLLDTIPSESFDESGQEKYKELFGLCVSELSEKLIIKKHPRDNREYGEICNIYQYPTIPFEVICANSNIGKKVLISAGSSAVLMPKILFGSEPVVIMLHHITGNRLGDDVKREKMISYIRDLYHDKARFIVPETIEDFSNIIKTLKQEGGIPNDLL